MQALNSCNLFSQHKENLQTPHQLSHKSSKDGNKLRFGTSNVKKMSIHQDDHIIRTGKKSTSKTRKALGDISNRQGQDSLKPERNLEKPTPLKLHFSSIKKEKKQTSKIESNLNHIQLLAKEDPVEDIELIHGGSKNYDQDNYYMKDLRNEFYNFLDNSTYDLIDESQVGHEILEIDEPSWSITDYTQDVMDGLTFDLDFSDVPPPDDILDDQLDLIPEADNMEEITVRLPPLRGEQLNTPTRLTRNSSSTTKDNSELSPGFLSAFNSHLNVSRKNK